MKRFNFILSISVLAMLLCFSDASYGQVAGGGPPGPPGDPPCWPPPCVPIDGGMGLLLAAGALIGGKKLYDLNKEGDTKS